ncbi:MAG: hypothetical protein M3525_14140, partial [Acidobacteriota bacterium]|nr:hypothetical protein [Acidobacteriota bacterium]
MKIYGLFLVIFFVSNVSAQSLHRDFQLSANGSVEIINLYGRVEISADTAEKTDESDVPKEIERAFLTAENARDSDLKIVSENNRLVVVVQPTDAKTRVDLILK